MDRWDAINTAGLIWCSRRNPSLPIGAVTMTPAITDRVQNIARSMSRRAPAESEDLLQEGMLGAWLAMRRFDGRGTLVGWCAIRAEGAMIDYLRTHEWKSKRKGNRPRFCRLKESIQAKSIDENIQLLVQYAIRTVQRCPQISPRHKFVVLATTIGDMTYAEAGAVIGVKLARAHQMANHSIKILRRINEIRIARPTRP